MSLPFISPTTAIILSLFLKVLCSVSSAFQMCRGGLECVDRLNYTTVCALTGVARLRVHGNHHFASCSSPRSQGALQRGDTAGCLVAVTSYNSERFQICSVNHIDQVGSID